jgi:formate hydrogenlyase subunit 6/NADH:ubiquinone oxidoreductase subunit I
MAQREAPTELPLELKLSLRLFLRLFQSLSDDVPSTLVLVARVPGLLAGLPALALYSSNVKVCVACAVCKLICSHD